VAWRLRATRNSSARAAAFRFRSRVTSPVVVARSRGPFAKRRSGFRLCGSDAQRPLAGPERRRLGTILSISYATEGSSELLIHDLTQCRSSWHAKVVAFRGSAARPGVNTV